MQVHSYVKDSCIWCKKAHIYAKKELARRKSVCEENKGSNSIFTSLKCSLVGREDCVMLSFLGINYNESQDEISAYLIGMQVLKMNLVFLVDHRLTKRLRTAP